MQGTEMSIASFFRRRRLANRVCELPPPVDVEEHRKAIRSAVDAQLRQADAVVRRVARNSNIREEDVISETQRIMENRPVRPGDLLSDLVRPPSRGGLRRGNNTA
jgi:hypothetical protein